MSAPPPHPDPWRNVDAQPLPSVEKLAQGLEERGRTRTQVRLRRRFLRFVPIRRRDVVLEVGAGTGVVARDLAMMVGPGGRVVGVDPSRALLRIARTLCTRHPAGSRIALRAGDGARLPFPAARFDVAIALTVILHVGEPLAVVREMARLVKPGGRVALQDQDFGVVAAAHPDRALTDRILDGVAAQLYEEPYSGRRLPGLLREAGLERVRLRTDVYQDTTLEPFTKLFLERRAEAAVTYGIADADTARRWLDGFNTMVARRAFVLTMNYYGAVGEKPVPRAG